MSLLDPGLVVAPGAATADAAARPASPPRPLLGVFGRPTDALKVLLVEDDVVDRKAVERWAQKEGIGWSLVAVGSYADARERLAAETWDVVLSDFDLGDGTATDILGLGIDAPVVVVTGAGDEETAVEALRAGAYDYLVKDLDRRYLKLLPLTVATARRRFIGERQAQILAQAVRSLHDCVLVTDLEGRIVYVNDAFVATYGWSAEELVGQPEVVVWSAGDTATPLSSGETRETRHRTRDGRELLVLVTRSTVVDERGQPVAVVAAARDIGERVQWERALAESEQRYALAAAGANDGLWDWDLRREELYLSPRWKATLGFGDDELGSSLDDWLSLVHEDDRELLRAQISAHHEGQTPHFESEHRIRTYGGEYRWVQVRGLAVRGENGEVQRMVGSQRDVTDRKRVEEQLSHAALHDALTGLPNRALFMDRLASAIGRARRRADFRFGVVYLDLDRFKVINDGLGHLAGDRLLQGMARRLEGCVRLGDTVARLSGDEFAILLEDLEDDPSQAERAAERLDHALRAPFEIVGHEVFSSASLGIALSSQGYERPEEVLRDADTAMYRAKSLGRTWAVFDPEMHQRAVARLHLETDLRRAIERQELRLHYQPIVRLEDGRLHGFEALLRWQHPERGLLLPADFLSVVHETGLSLPVGAWVLAEACRQLRDWQTDQAGAGELQMSVNVDGRHLSSAELLTHVDVALASSGLDPRHLALEITEGMIVENPEVATGMLERLRGRGIRIHIDDFGTGYSSLGQLPRFPIHTLKIDRSFVAGMAREGRELVRTIVSLAHDLGLEVTAEGIETGEQLQVLRALGCELGQGFYFSRPLPAAALGELLAGGYRFGGGGDPV